MILGDQDRFRTAANRTLFHDGRRVRHSDAIFIHRKKNTESSSPAESAGLPGAKAAMLLDDPVQPWRALVPVPFLLAPLVVKNGSKDPFANSRIHAHARIAHKKLSKAPRLQPGVACDIAPF